MLYFKALKRFCISAAACAAVWGACFPVFASGESQEVSPEGISPQEVEMIEAVVMHEVGYCSRESMIAVAHVILNRMESPFFPDTVSEVLHQEGQFTAIHNYYDWERPVTPKVKAAVADALEMTDVTGGAFYFYSPRYMKQDYSLRWFQSLETTLIYEGVWYCK
jgi:N-acetylmuramoyl-L-alanine amidase